MARNYAALPYEYIEELAELTDVEFGRLIRGLLIYSRDGVPIEADGNERYAARRVMNREDRYRAEFAKAEERMQKAARKRWEAKHPGEAMPGEAQPEEAMHNDAVQHTCACMHNDAVQHENACIPNPIPNPNPITESEADTESELIGNKKSVEKKAADAAPPPAPPAAKPKREKKETQEEMYDRLATVFAPGAISDTLDHEIRLWLRYKTERKELYKESGMAALLRKIVLDKVVEHGEAAVCSLIEDCMASNYSGIIWDRLDKPQGSGPGRQGSGRNIIKQMEDW